MNMETLWGSWALWYLLPLLALGLMMGAGAVMGLQRGCGWGSAARCCGKRMTEPLGGRAA